MTLGLSFARAISISFLAGALVTAATAFAGPKPKPPHPGHGLGPGHNHGGHGGGGGIFPGWKPGKGPKSDPNAPPALIGNAVYGGSGCPQGSLSTAISPDQTALAVLFDRFVVEAGGTTGKGKERLNCTLSIPLTLPDGYALSVVTMDLRGFTSLPKGARAAVNATHAFAHKKIAKLWKGLKSDIVKGPIDDVFYFQQSVPGKWTSGCGGIAQFNVTLSLGLEAIQAGQQLKESALASLDTLDTTSAPIIYGIELRKCK
jgi:hypothetical protein